MKNLIMMRFKVVHILILALISAPQFAYSQKSYLLEIGQRDSLYSKILDETREFYIEFPESYEAGSLKKYPVVFVLDGEKLINAVSVVHDFYWGGFIPEMVIVGISNEKNRTRDLSTSKIDTKYGMPFNEESGAAERFTQFIEKELIPCIEEKYPVTEYRTLIGHSYGGLFTINTLLYHNNLFANYLAIDPSLDWDNQSIVRQAKGGLSGNTLQNKSLFLTLGGQLHMQDENVTIENVMKDTSEYTLFARSNIEFSRIAEASPVKTYWKYYPDDLHGSIPLPSIMDGLIKLFSWYPIENTELFNKPDTPKEVLIEQIRGREKKLKEHFGYFVPPLEEDLLNMLGYMNLDWGKKEKSLALFELGIEYFPDNPNSYDSLADYYEAIGEYKKALRYVTKAYELSGNTYHKNRMTNLSGK